MLTIKKIAHSLISVPMLQGTQEKSTKKTGPINDVREKALLRSILARIILGDKCVTIQYYSRNC